jgi:meiotically up-regulated gene 157 (Mug157) protein
MQSGHGAPCARTGMSKCQFRPSDDAVVYPFLVPANAMAVVELRKVADVVTNTAGENPDFTIDEQKELGERGKASMSEATSRRLLIIILYAVLLSLRFSRPSLLAHP